MLMSMKPFNLCLKKGMDSYNIFFIRQDQPVFASLRLGTQDEQDRFTVYG
jgi:hypothetical protein